MSLNLNKKQILAFNLFKSKYNIFITGGAGTGKSFITCCFQDYIDSQQIDNESFSITSTTGISALNIGGITIHNWAGLDHNTDINKVGDFVKKIQNNYSKLNNYLYTKMLVIDEISMLDSNTLDFINTVAKKIRENDEPFGGIQ